MQSKMVQSKIEQSKIEQSKIELNNIKQKFIFNKAAVTTTITHPGYRERGNRNTR